MPLNLFQCVCSYHIFSYMHSLCAHIYEMLYNYKNARIASKQTVRNLKIHLQVNVNKITHQTKQTQNS